MSKPAPARYRTTNWADDIASLRRRGSLFMWLDKEMTWPAPHDDKARMRCLKAFSERIAA